MVVSISEHFSGINYQNESQIISLAEADNLTDSNDTCRIMLANYSVVILEKDPALGDDTVDTDRDGIPDIIELKEKKMISLENPSSGTKIEVEVWTFDCNPANVDTDGDGLTDIEDLQPKKYDTVVVEENDSYIKFNTGRIWYNISCTAEEYWSNVLLADGRPSGEYPVIANKCRDNGKQDFTVEELSYIGIMDNEVSKLYMENKSQEVREKVFQNITGRESRYYRHTGLFEYEKWEEVPKGTESGFFSGAVLSEADINFTCAIYSYIDVYITMTTLVQVGAIVIAMVVVYKVAPVVLTNLQALSYYVKTFGLKQGFEMYRYLGVQNLPNGIISWLQMDMADGDSSLDDVLSATKLKHPMNKHMPSRFAYQLQYMNEETARRKVSSQTFFDASWTEYQIIQALNIGYRQAIKSGVTTGKYVYEYLGRTITIYIENGVFHTGYGDVIYTYEELLKMIG